MQGLLDTIQKNIEFVGISLLLMIGVFAIARGSEVLIEKRQVLSSRLRKQGSTRQ